MILDRNALLASFLLLGVFLGGAVVGGVVVVIARGPPPPGLPMRGPEGPGHGPPPHRPPPPRPPPARVAEDLRRALSLEDDQARAVMEIVVQTDGAIERTFREGEERIRSLLSPEQRPRFEEFMRRGPRGDHPHPR
jgi:hypothetical protein